MKFSKAWATTAAVFALIVGLLPGTAAAAEKISMGTLAPKASIWGQVFSVWEKAVSKKSDGKVELAFFYNGQQGDEGSMVGKMKAGQLDGAAITAVGLSKIYTPILALQLPGALTTWEKLEKAQGALKGDFEKGVNDAGFQLLGWGNVGQAHMFTKGEAVKTPGQLKSKKPYMWRDDKISPVFYQVVGATGVPLNVPEVLPQLKTGAINFVNSPALAVEQLQWAPELTSVGEDVSGCAIGALVVTSKRLDALPGDLRTIVTDTGTIAAKALGEKIKAEDKAAFERLKAKMTLVKLSDAERAEWKKAFADTRARLGQGTFDPALIKKIEGFAGL